jgi:putative membrane protein
MNIKKFVIQLLINAFAFFVAITLLRGQGIDLQGGNIWLNYLSLALIFGIINAILRPILSVLGCPVIILTLGLGVLLINTLVGISSTPWSV